MEDTETTFLGCLGILLSLPLCWIVRGWALSLLWGWFIVTTFHLPALSTWQAFAVSLVVGLFTYNPNYAKEDPEYTYIYKLSISLFGPLFSVGVGWLVRHWV